MKVGILCEFSGIVRDAFLANGHDAISCDLVDTTAPGPHIIGDCLAQDWSSYDLLICHPPCTYLSVSGARWWKGRAIEQLFAIDFVKKLWALPVAKIAIENPIGKLSTAWCKPTQIIQPWMFGHDASKATCLWLKGLPPLVPTDILPGGKSARRANQTPSGQNNLGPSPTRAAERSKTYLGVGLAMAAQWGNRP